MGSEMCIRDRSDQGESGGHEGVSRLIRGNTVNAARRAGIDELCRDGASQRVTDATGAAIAIAIATVTEVQVDRTTIERLSLLGAWCPSVGTLRPPPPLNENGIP